MNKAKVTIIGAGSFFTNQWIKDILLAPAPTEGVFALVDINQERLELTRQMANKMINELGGGWEVATSTDREELLPNTDYLINTIEVSGTENVRYDYDIPKEYGIDQCIGDTIGPGGIMKALRTVPEWLKVLSDAEKMCPDALVLNYTNPMHMMTLATDHSCDLASVGLCHSVPHTSRQLAEYLDIPYGQLDWECAGINHMSWFTTLEKDGENLYPLLKERAKDPELYKKDPIRFEMMYHLGAFVTESSGHFSEYIPYFRKSQDLIDRYCESGYRGESGFYTKNWPMWGETQDKIRRLWIEGKEIPSELVEKIPLGDINIEERSNEYGSYIIEAHWTDTPEIIYGNFTNNGLISNLPADGVVEVKTLVDGTGFQPIPFGELPEQLAALNRSNMSVHKLVVDSILREDKDKAYQAFMLDPLTAAVSYPEEIRNMADELFEVEREYIPDYLMD